MVTNIKQDTKTIKIYSTDYDILKKICGQQTPPSPLAEAVELLCRMYEEASDVEEDTNVVTNDKQEVTLHVPPVIEELLEPEVTEPVAPVVEINTHTEPAEQKVYTGLLSRFLRKEGQPIVSKHKVVVIKHGDGL